MTIKEGIPLLAGTLDALRALWNTAKESHPTIVLSAQQALRAIDSEVQADYLLTQVTPQDLLDIYTLCEAVKALADALELWAYTSARLWLECEQQEPDMQIQTLYHSCVSQFQRLLVRHYALQSEVYQFCQSHNILVRFDVIPLSLNLPLAEISEEKVCRK